MEKKYLKPAIEITDIEVEQHLLDASAFLSNETQGNEDALSRYDDSTFFDED